jgi:hypothetical protein
MKTVDLIMWWLDQTKTVLAHCYFTGGVVSENIYRSLDVAIGGGLLMTLIV